MKAITTIILLLLINVCLGQMSVTEYANKADSIKRLKPTKENLTALNNLSFRGKYLDHDITEHIVDYVLKHSDKPNFELISAFAHKVKGITCDETGRYHESIEHYLKAIEKYDKAGSDLDVAKCEGNIGMIFRKQHKYPQALDYFNNSLVIFEAENFDYGSFLTFMNIGVIKMKLDQPDSSIFYLKRAEELMVKLNTFDPNLYGNLGNAYLKLKDYDSAQENYLICVKSYESNESQSSVIWYFSYGDFLRKKGKLKEALVYIEKAKNLTGKNIYNNESVALFEISALLKYKTKQFKESADNYMTLSDIQDSLYKFDNSKLTSELSEKYQTEKRKLQIENLNKEKKLEEQKVFYLIIGSILLVVIVIYSVIGIYIKIKDNKKIKAKNILIQHQKEVVEEKSAEILDSIKYAKRLQNAILPAIKLIKEHFVDSFVLFKPKDIVSGDFYWMETKKNLTMFAAADCTGHGVPGAMVSVVCANALNKSVNEKDITDPGKILDSTRNIVVETFSKTNSDVKDGMDISICVYNTLTKELLWAGANNPLWIVRKGSKELESITPNKQPIGMFENQLNFTTHNIKINSGDSIYMFSDGYADQFGGDRGKKMKTKKFREIILEIQDQNMIEQKNILDDHFEDWKADLEQIDDVCVIGVRF
jgi:serine phosphatase RsbU (regulator of sigma subunit)/Tfp pilus assembly protein PilF